MVTKEKEEKKFEVETTNPFAHSKIRLTAAQLKQLENLKLPEEKVSTLDPAMQRKRELLGVNSDKVFDSFAMR